MTFDTTLSCEFAAEHLRAFRDPLYNLKMRILMARINALLRGDPFEMALAASMRDAEEKKRAQERLGAPL